MKSRYFGALAAACAALTAIAVAAVVLLPNVVDQPSRFSGPGVYTGQPALPVTLSMIMAGGGPEKFSTLTLVHVLAGAKTDAEVASLKAKFGDAKVMNFVKVFDFVVADSLKQVTEHHVALPAKPMPDPANGPALAKALWLAGQTGHSFNVEVMLDRAVSHPIHSQVMTDIDNDPKLGLAADADYHAVLNQAMNDLASVYGLSVAGAM